MPTSYSSWHRKCNEQPVGVEVGKTVTVNHLGGLFHFNEIVSYF